jgi:hypothetical protein
VANESGARLRQLAESRRVERVHGHGCPQSAGWLR